ncbi:MAG: response regulator [Polyangiaceae bacterium]
MQTPKDVRLPRRPTVLVVDDDDAIRDVVSEVLRDEGYDVACAANGEQALAALRRECPPDLMLLDLMMPVMSGWELLEQLQEHAGMCTTKIVVVSAMASPGHWEHLAKPIDLGRLLDTVKHLTAG